MDDEKKVVSTEETEKNKNNDEQISLDSLLLDDEANSDAEEISLSEFEAFMSEYRTLIGSSMANKSEEPEEIDEEDEKEFLKSPPKKKQLNQVKKDESPQAENGDDSDWSRDITLAPEEYEVLDNPAEPKAEIDVEEPVPDFDLGERDEESDDKFQISINFDGEQRPVSHDEDEPAKGYDPEKPRIIDWVFDFAEMFVFVLLAVMILTSFVFKHSVVEGDSMLNTLEDGDHLIISSLFYTPSRGDIIVFEDYSTILKKAVVKRVIGLPGETVEIKVNEKGVYEVYINGELLEEDYAYTNIDYSMPGVGVWQIDEGEIFVMGDNRYNSTDSRDKRVGPVDIDSVLGKVLFRFYPFDKFGTID